MPLCGEFCHRCRQASSFLLPTQLPQSKSFVPCFDCFPGRLQRHEPTTPSNRTEKNTRDEPRSEPRRTSPMVRTWTGFIGIGGTRTVRGPACRATRLGQPRPNVAVITLPAHPTEKSVAAVNRVSTSGNSSTVDILRVGNTGPDSSGRAEYSVAAGRKASAEPRPQPRPG